MSTIHVDVVSAEESIFRRGCLWPCPVKPANRYLPPHALITRHQGRFCSH